MAETIFGDETEGPRLEKTVCVDCKHKIWTYPTHWGCRRTGKRDIIDGEVTYTPCKDINEGQCPNFLISRKARKARKAFYKKQSKSLKRQPQQLLLQKGREMFSLGIRKLVVIALVVGVLLLGNIWLVVNWLDSKGVIDGAQYIRKEYLTGTAITIIVVLLILLVRPVRRYRRNRGEDCPS